MITFTCYTKPEPQGSMKAYVRGGLAVLVSDNSRLNHYRDVLSICASTEMNCAGHLFFPVFDKHIPVALTITCGFLKPKSAKKRAQHVVKPDSDKLARAIFDALTGVIFHDDAQVVHFSIGKVYAEREYVEVSAWGVCE